MNKTSQAVVSVKLSKVIDLNTLYFAIRRASWSTDEKKYVPDSGNLFYSNAFKPGKFKIYFFIYIQFVS